MHGRHYNCNAPKTMLQTKMPGFVALALLALTQIELPRKAMAADVNYDESKVPAYTLPDPLVLSDGTHVDDADVWRQKRRPEILELFRTHMYGRSPGKPEAMTFAVLETDRQSLAGKATRKRVAIRFLGRADGPAMELLIYLPNPSSDAKAAGKPGEIGRPCPLFVGIHLFPKSASVPNPGLPLVEVLKKSQGKDAPLTLSFPTKGEGTTELPGERLAETILARGYGFATIDAADLAPDSVQDYLKGVISTLGAQRSAARGGRRLGSNLGLGLGAVAGDGLFRDRQRNRRPQDCRDRPFADGQDGTVGGRAGRAVRRGHLEQLRLRWGGPLAAAIRRDRGIDQPALSLLVLRQLSALQRPRGHAAAGSAHADRSDRTAGRVRGQRQGRPLGRSAGRVSGRAWPPSRCTVYWARTDWAWPTCRLSNKSVGQSEKQAIGYHLRVGGHAMTDFDWLAYLDFADGQLRGRLGGTP